MSWLWEKILNHTRYRHPDAFSETAVRILADEIVKVNALFERRLYALEHADELEADRRANLTTGEICREDNERL